MGHTILLADDSITIQKVIELTFSDEDFTLHTVGNGQKAIEEVRSVKPDIVLCDIIMPEKNGYEVCEFIKSDDELNHIPVLLLTGAFEPFDQDRARKAGCDGFLAKPFEPQTLVSKVRELLASAEARPTAPTPAVAESPAPVAPPAPFEEPPTVEMGFKPGQPPAPPSPMEDEGATILADDFAIEAGERELSVEPEDQTVLLGEDETPTVPSEDIWKEVQQTQDAQPPAAQTSKPESATVSIPPVEEVPSEKPAASAEPSGDAAVFDAMSSAAEDEAVGSDMDAWALPPTEEPPPPQPAEPELTPLGDFGGFGDFEAARTGEPPAEEPAAPEASISELPEPPPTLRSKPPIDLSPGAEAIPFTELPSEAPTAQEPVSPAAPATPGPPAEEPFAAAVERVASPPGPEKEPVVAAPEVPSSTQDLDALAEKVAEKVIAKLSDKVIKEIAWEVVPDLAQTLIQKEIDALKAKIPK